MDIEEFKDLRDPIHGFIRVYKQELEIIDHPIFQRLRNIKQLSFAYTVYHGAEHSRFGHSLGVMYLVDTILKKIKKNSKLFGNDIDITDEDIYLSRLAALLHDVGHFPFSHALDKLMPNEHEDYSVSIVENVFASSIEKAKINVKDVTDLIKGKPQLNKPFLSSLINSQLDVDKFDYLLRDSHYAGVTYGIFDLNRLTDSLAVINNELLVLDNGYYAAEQMIISRYHMFEQLYYHHTKRAFEEMARKIATYMINNKEMDYPIAKDLDKENTQKQFTEYDDSWFMKKIKEVSKKDLRDISQEIDKRISYKLILDSGNIWKKKELDVSAARGIVMAIENDIKYNFESWDITESKIIFDEFSSIPYKLRPYIRTSGPESEDEEPEIIYIYNKKFKTKKAIEEISPIIKTLARENFSTRRVYIDRDKFDIVNKKLKEKYPQFL